MTAASTHMPCRRCGLVLHRDQFTPQNRVCRRCNNVDRVANRRHRRRTDPTFRERERAQDRLRKARIRAEAQADARWRQEWARRTVVRLHGAGWTYVAISRESGLAEQTIQRWARGVGTHIKTQQFERFWDWARSVEARAARGGA